MQLTGARVDTEIEDFGVILDSADYFRKYMKEFELTIMAEGASRKTIGHTEFRSVTPGKLHKTRFGDKMGLYTESPIAFAIDYYGHLKKSSTLVQEIDEIRKQCFGKQVKAMTFWVIHFASIRIETVAQLNHRLVSGFPLFKREILDTRGFKTKF
jgi:hypothetical protein